MGSRRPERDKGIRRPSQRRPRARLGTSHVLPRLRVVLDHQGCFTEVIVSRPSVTGGDEGWWQAVMNDWRRVRQTHHHFDRLVEHSGATVVIVCKQCSLRREFAIRELIALYGPDYRMVHLRYDLAECPAGKGYKDCGVLYSDL